ncbi:glucosamine-6-phosphate deaminase [Rhodopirellula bahusiensis]|uniref:Glucosamine-6-phosphate deaminase n=1 Tax=Rhodopirellula bahusiensis TaxID=2014065 RepID=A0A2G1VY94_9BACT|nr:glucosamine-6-phosphate deaminase [Rhodopirellula bahusiensis]PHQ31705.1 glucosamine-6-phosphate deaminase [Rhodopirellula bahusiensis]
MGGINVIELEIVADHESASARLAGCIVEQVRREPASVLGLATGGTPERTYELLVEKVRAGHLSFSQATTFNLDEYVGLPPAHPQSYHAYMRSRLFGETDFDPKRTHLPDGTADDLAKAGEQYEALITEAGGIDLQLLGLGANGHIGFNEPGATEDSRTRVVDLTEETIAANARFFEAPEDVPRRALTMGIATILEAREIVLIATGESKAEAVERAVRGPVTSQMPASFLQQHSSVTFVLDEAAASLLGSRA